MKINLKDACGLTGLSSKTVKKIFPVNGKGIKKYNLSEIMLYLKTERDKYTRFYNRAEALSKIDEM